jgi:hypothetical protein
VENYIAFSKATPEAVVAEWQKAFEAMKADGTYARLQQTAYPE